MNKKQRLVLILGVIIVLGIGLWAALGRNNTQNAGAAQKTAEATPAPASFDKKRYSLTDPTSWWVIVNKQHPLQPKTYVPSDLVVPTVPLRVPGNVTMQLRVATANALESMFAGAKATGLNLMLASGYRSYQYQVSLYNGYVQSQGQAVADQQSARPGYSEHQTGQAADVEPVSKTCELEACFQNMPEGKWVAANAYKYGFIIRYTADKTAVTGYEFEPWHIRYVGTALSIQMHNQHIETLEEFFSVTGGSTYSTAN
jgi:D-alanyl-D-alanine carboxypeptidase